jgi:hypothetical protein
MPSRRIGAYKIAFFSADCQEKPHVHVRRRDGEAKVWLEPVEVTWAKRLRPQEVREIEELVTDHRNELLSWWRKFCEGAT